MSRRVDHAWTYSSRPARILITRVFGVIVILLAAGYVGVSTVTADQFTRPKRIAVVGSPADLGLTFETVEFASLIDGISLRGWWMPAPGSDRAVVIVHGRNSTRSASNGDLTKQAQGLVKAGYSVLSFDLRAHGESGGERYSFGPLERRDVLGAVVFVRARGIPSGHIAFLCHSMGAATCLLTAPDAADVSAVVADSAYARFTDILDIEFPKQSRLPALFIPGGELMADVLYGIDVTKAAPIEVVDQIRPRPILFIHGESDTYVPPENSRRLWRASGESPELLWLLPGVEHDLAYRSYPEEYLHRVIGFLDAAVP
jgi:alpha-beta hydrolase superfamily lysophospholipase